MKRFILSLFVLVCALTISAQPKYIFYFIGDGMGINQVLLTEMYLAQIKGEIGRNHLCMTQFPVAASASSYSASNSITDSSAAGTCLASGSKTNNGRLGLDPKDEHHATIAEQLHEMGWAIGITTSVSIDHATPGAFYAKVASRNDYYTIGTQLADSKFEFFGGATFMKPVDPYNPNRPSVYKLCRDNEYTFCHGYKEYNKNMGDKVILIQDYEGLDDEKKGNGKIPYAIDREPKDLTLPQITEVAIDFLSAKDRPFFLMVEGGQIDWASHGNDAATVIHETIDFDRAIRLAFDFYKEHPDETLIVVTADHETGGLALGNSDYTLHLDLLKNQKVSANVVSDQLVDLRRKMGKKLTFGQVKRLFSETLGLFGEVEVSAEEEAELLATFKLMMKNKANDSKNMYASLNALSDQAVRLLNKKAHVGWTTHSHSAAPVPVFAIGKGAERFSGFYDNSDIAPLIFSVATGKDYKQKIALPEKPRLDPRSSTRLMK